MPYKTGPVITGLILGCILCVLFPVLSHGGEGNYPWELPVAAPAAEYGNLLINRASEKNGVRPVIFSHWLHRQKYTCRVCHFELEFNMKVNTTEITEQTSRAGMHCGTASCHDGKAAFGHEKPHCEKCHTGDRSSGKEKFELLATRLPRSKYGNQIDWNESLKKGLITPVHFLSNRPPENMNYKTQLTLKAKWANIPPAVFPHDSHVKWLDCNNCHPDIFNIKKKTTRHFEIERILKGEFCGVCHLTVAFPVQNCQACHPQMSEK